VLLSGDVPGFEGALLNVSLGGAGQQQAYWRRCHRLAAQLRTVGRRMIVTSHALKSRLGSE
jgi:hypothetical protein